MDTRKRTKLLICNTGQQIENDTYSCFPSTREPLSCSIEAIAESSDSNWTKPYPLLFPSSDMATLQDKIFPNLRKISCSFALSITSLKFCSKILNLNYTFQIRHMYNLQKITNTECTLMNTFATPLLLISGSRRDQLTLITFPFRVEWFFTSTACTATMCFSKIKIKQ